MKTLHSLFFSLLITMGFSSPVVLAGEPNPSAIEQSKMKKVDKNMSSQTTPSRDCPPEMTHEKNAHSTGARHRGPQHTGVLKE